MEMYPKANKYIWSQDEPRNAGCWSFVSKRFAHALGVNLEYVGRKGLSWTATAIAQHHQKEIQDVIEETFALCQYTRMYKEIDVQEIEIDSSEVRAVHLEGNWKRFQQAPKAFAKWDTGVDADFLRYSGAASVKTPTDFNVHPHLTKTHCDARVAKMEKGEGIDSATAEALAFGSILLQGNDVRISG